MPTSFSPPPPPPPSSPPPFHPRTRLNTQTPYKSPPHHARPTHSRYHLRNGKSYFVILFSVGFLPFSGTKYRRFCCIAFLKRLPPPSSLADPKLYPPFQRRRRSRFALLTWVLNPGSRTSSFLCFGVVCVRSKTAAISHRHPPFFTLFSSVCLCVHLPFDSNDSNLCVAGQPFVCQTYHTSSLCVRQKRHNRFLCLSEETLV